jgi:hypothetical protein
MGATKSDLNVSKVKLGAMLRDHNAPRAPSIYEEKATFCRGFIPNPGKN